MHQKNIGPRVSEYAQTSPSTIDYHVYPLGNKVIKAFMANNSTFYNKSGDPDHLEIQKNRQHGQAITLLADDDHFQLGPICAALQMVLLARGLGQPGSLPVACHIFKKKRVYLTSKRVATLFREEAKSIHPNTLKDEL